MEKFITIGLVPRTSKKSDLYNSDFGLISEVIDSKDNCVEIVLVCIFGGIQELNIKMKNINPK